MVELVDVMIFEDSDEVVCMISACRAVYGLRSCQGGWLCVSKLRYVRHGRLRGVQGW